MGVSFACAVQKTSTNDLTTESWNMKNTAERDSISTDAEMFKHDPLESPAGSVRSHPGVNRNAGVGTLRKIRMHHGH